MRRLIAIFLSLVLVYAGAAHALAACVDHRGHEHHASRAMGERSMDHHSMTKASDSQDSSVPVIHCTPLNQQVGAAVPTASFELTRSDRIVPLPAVFVPGESAATLRNDLWLEAVFKQMISFSLPIDPARHLFLSVFQI